MVVTHDVNLAAEFSDQVMLMKAGRRHRGGRTARGLEADLLAEVFGLQVLVDAHPISGAPRITPVYSKG